jgi:hypothetical protein
MNHRAVALILTIILALGLSAFAQENEKKEAAEAVAATWLKVVDSGGYAQSWEETASGFKAAVTRPQWEQAMRANRAPLGAVQSRKLLSATYTTQLPGAPDGEYVVLQYDASFEHKKTAIETVTPVMDKDGKWRVSGYYIK